MNRTFAIIDLIKQGDCSTLSEFAERLDCSESTIHYYLKTLERNEYIVRNDDGYRIGLRFLTLGGHAKRQHEVYEKLGREAIETLLDELSDRTGEIAVLATEECEKCQILHVSRRNEGVSRDFALGTEHPLHLTAVGKAILSTYDDEEIFGIIDGDDSSDDSESHVAATMDEFQQIRDRGFAFNDQARINGERGIAVPVTNEQNGRAICAVGIVGSVDAITEPGINSKPRRFMQNNTQLIQQTAQTIMNKLYM